MRAVSSLCPLLTTTATVFLCRVVLLTLKPCPICAFCRNAKGIPRFRWGRDGAVGRTGCGIPIHQFLAARACPHVRRWYDVTLRRSLTNREQRGQNAPRTERERTPHQQRPRQLINCHVTAECADFGAAKHLQNVRYCIQWHGFVSRSRCGNWNIWRESLRGKVDSMIGG
jgi:hypothetical protein